MAIYAGFASRFFHARGWLCCLALGAATLLLSGCALQIPETALSLDETTPPPSNASAPENHQLNLPQIQNDSNPVTSTPEGWWTPLPGTSWQWQLSGAVDTSIEAEMYDIDLFDAPQALIDQLHSLGRIVICYFSAGSWESWRPDAGNYPPEILGKPLEGWEDERWIDIRQIEALEPILAGRLDLARQKGCDGVEPDNVDGYANDTGFPLEAADQLEFNTWLSGQAHTRGLSIGLKNDLAQIPDLLPYFDWVLNEQCFEFDECDLLLPFVQSAKAVFGVEYNLEPEQFCPKANALDFDWLKKKIELDSFRVACR